MQIIVSQLLREYFHFLIPQGRFDLKIHILKSLSDAHKNLAFKSHDFFNRLNHMKKNLLKKYFMFQTVGCDHVLDSKTTIDICGVCGGDNSTCFASMHSASGRYRWIQTGYGSCSVTCGVGSTRFLSCVVGSTRCRSHAV